VFDNHAKFVQHGDKLINLSLWDTAGQEDYAQVRPLTYPQTDVIIVAFSISSPHSFNNVRYKWWPEIQHYAPGVPIILVGTKCDLRNDQSMFPYLSATGISIKEEEADTRAEEIGAQKYLECSALTQEGLKNVFDEAIYATLSKPSNTGKFKGCTLL
jgi:Ras-related C3 botulinum toxin substrate 1